MEIVFAETIQEVADRLGVSYNFARIRLALLKERLGGRKTNNEVKWGLVDPTASDLRRTLQLDADLSPAPLISETGDLAWGRQTWQAVQSGYTFGGQGLPRTALAAPYGYTKDRHDQVVLYKPQSDAVRLAFYLLEKQAATIGSLRYTEVSRELNERGYVRKNGKPFAKDSLRDWPRTPAYAGYVKRGWRDVPYVEPYPNMPIAIVDLSVFLTVARLGRDREQAWVRHLAEYLE